MRTAAKRSRAAKRSARTSRTKARTLKKKASRARRPKKAPRVAKRPSVKRPALAKPARRVPAAAAKGPAPAAPAPRRQTARPTLDRERRRLADIERLEGPAVDVDLEQDMRSTLSARAGREELKQAIARHTETSPVMTAGDIDAKWEDAYAIGDEAPGGDNPTPDQDRVDDIGRALGVTYADAEELRGSDKVAERDKHRWELDPASSDDWPHNPGKK